MVANPHTTEPILRATLILVMLALEFAKVHSRFTYVNMAVVAIITYTSLRFLDVELLVPMVSCLFPATGYRL